MAIPGRILSLILLAALTLPAATLKLYLTDGTHHLVREYKVLPDRVRFYSTERSQWEEIPLDLVDLKKTRTERGEIEAEERKEQAMIDAEEAVERRLRDEAQGIPSEAGVYRYEEGKLRTFPLADLEVENDKKRSFLKAITPLPMVAGKNYVEIKGPRSPHVVRQARPEFYIRVHRYQKFGFLRLDEHKGNRLVQIWEIVPISKQIIETHNELEDFRREAGPMLYQIWPREPLSPGEYVLATWAPGEGNIRVWDFGYYPEGSGVPAVSTAK